MKFYQSVLGGKLDLRKYSDMPEMPVAEVDKDKIVHALLENDTLTLKVLFSNLPIRYLYATILFVNN